MARQDRFDRLFERWSLQPDDLDVGPQVLGTGSFGEVRAGTLRDGNSIIEVAVKLLPMDGNCEETWKKIGGEAVLLAKVSERCKSTSRLYGMCLRDDKFCLVMKKYVTSLEKKIGEYPDRKAPRKLVEQWALDICEAVVELHAQNVAIRDLKPSNVLLDEFDGAILADFGISKMVGTTISQRRTSTAVAGTLAYMAPESFTTKVADRSSKVDVWALGCLLLELYTGKAPWEGMDMANIMYQVLSLKEHPTIPSEMNREIADALEQCFVIDPIERASAMTILEALKKAFYQAPGSSAQVLDKCQTCSRIEDLEKEVEALTLQKDEAKLRMIAAEEKVVMLKVENVSYQLEQALKKAQDQVLAVNEDKKLELNRSKDMASKMSSLEAKVAELKTTNAKLRKELNDSPIATRVLQFEMDALERDVKKLSGIRRVLSEENSNLTEKVSTLEEEKRQLQQHIREQAISALPSRTRTISTNEDREPLRFRSGFFGYTKSNLADAFQGSHQ